MLRLLRHLGKGNGSESKNYECLKIVKTTDSMLFNLINSFKFASV